MVKFLSDSHDVKSAEVKEEDLEPIQVSVEGLNMYKTRQI